MVPSTKANCLTLSSDFAGTLAKHFGGRAIISDGAKYNFLFEKSSAKLVECWEMGGIKWEFQSSKGLSFKVLLALDLC